MSANGDGTNPVQSDKVPCERSRDSADVHHAGCSAMSKVRSREIEEVDHDEEKRRPVMATGPQVQESKEQEIVEDIVGADVVRGGRGRGVRRVEERVDEGELDDEEREPVERCDDLVLSERCCRLALPDPVARLVALVRSAELVV